MAEGTAEPYSVTIGVFDGVHLGHQRLLAEASSFAPVCVITFSGNPRDLVPGTPHVGDICTTRQKLELLEAHGVDLTVLVDFDDEFRSLPGKRFLQMIRASVTIRAMVFGADFRCGRELDTDAGKIRRIMSSHGVRVDIVGPLQDNGKSVSSTRIRTAILSGDFGSARRMLGRPYVLDLRNAQAQLDGMVKRIPRSTVAQVQPPEGYYAGRFVISEMDSHSALPVAERESPIELAVFPDYIEVYRAVRCDLIELLDRKQTPVV